MAIFAAYVRLSQTDNITNSRAALSCAAKQ